LKPFWANSSLDPILKKPFTKKGWWSGSKYRPWVQAPVLKKKKKEIAKRILYRTGRVAQVVRGPEFKPYCHQNKINI
jgi:hypothetical protein